MQRIAIQGYRGSFHQDAAISHFGKEIDIEECLTFERVVEGVQNGKAHYGVMAVENSLAGCILPNFVLLRESGLNIIGEVYLKISQNLMALPNQGIQDLHQVQSHPMAIAQCGKFFRQYPGIDLMESHDTALSAQRIAKENLHGVGALGSIALAAMYGLEVIAPSIETHKDNFTRFMVISPDKHPIIKQQAVKATIAFAAQHVPGSLATILTSLAEEQVNLTMLQSLPMVGKAWEYIFHADLYYNTMEQAQASLHKLSRSLHQLWVLGVYPTGNNPKSLESKVQCSHSAEQTANPIIENLTF